MNKKMMKMGVLSLVATTVITGCDESERHLLIENSPKTVVAPNPEDNLIGTVIAIQTYARAHGTDASSLFFIDTDGNKKTAEYVGRLTYALHGDFVQGAGQAFNAEQTGMQKTIAQWRQTLKNFQPIQKEKQ